MAELTTAHNRSVADLSMFKGILKGKIKRMTKEERQKLFEEFVNNGGASNALRQLDLD